MSNSSLAVGQDDRAASHEQAASPWAMPAKVWADVVKRSWGQASNDNIGLISAGVAFYTFLALVPLLAAIVLTYGLVARPETVVQHASALASVLPAQVAELVGKMLSNVVETSGEKKGLGLFIALAIALWGARNAAGAVIRALNIVYEEDEDRGFVKVNLLALTITAVAVVIVLLAIAATTLLAALRDVWPQSGPVALLAWQSLSYALLALAAAAAIAALYRFGPSRDSARWRWISPGSLFAALAWIFVTLGFGFYVRNFGSYDATYGSLGAVIVLLTWMFLTAYILLFGAELNSELEHHTRVDTTRGPAEPMGQRGAWVADHFAGTQDDSPAPDDRPAPARTEPAAAQDRAPRNRTNLGVTVLAHLAIALVRRKGVARAGALVAAVAAIALVRRRD